VVVTLVAGLGRDPYRHPACELPTRLMLYGLRRPNRPVLQLAQAPRQGIAR